MEPSEDTQSQLSRAVTQITAAPRGPSDQDGTTVTVDTQTSMQRGPLGGANPIDDPLANRIGDILNATMPPLLAACVLLATIAFTARGMVSGDFWTGVAGAVVGYLFGTATKKPT